MDTRKKIVPAAAIPREAGAVRLVIGYFDPVVAEHIRRLETLRIPGELLVAAIDDPPDPLLPHAARAEMAASLVSIDYVVPDMAEALATLTDAPVADERPHHLAIRDRLGEVIRRRHSMQ